MKPTILKPSELNLIGYKHYKSIHCWSLSLEYQSVDDHFNVIKRPDTFALISVDFIITS